MDENAFLPGLLKMGFRRGHCLLSGGELRGVLGEVVGVPWI